MARGGNGRKGSGVVGEIERAETMDVDVELDVGIKSGSEAEKRDSVFEVDELVVKI